MTDEPLFGGYEPPHLPDPPVDRRSAGQGLTARQHADIARGIHPLTGEPTRPDLGRCGDCVFRTHVRHNAKTYAKCTRPDGRRITHGPATDVRAGWPACPAFEPKPS